MPYRQVIRAKKFGGQFAAHTRQHAERVARSATEPFRDRLPPGRKHLDLEEYQVAVGDELDRLDAELTAIDDRHAAQLVRNRQLRERRDRLTTEVRETLIQIKDGAEGHYGPGSARTLFQEDPPRIPSDPVAVLQLGDRVHDALNDPGFDLQPTQPGVQVNPKVLATSLEGPLFELGATLRELHDSESLTRHTQSEKDAKLAEAEAFEGNVARFLEAFYVLAGHKRLASRLRRSSHLRAALGAGPEEPAEDGRETEAAAETATEETGEEAPEETTEEATA